jgi:cell division septation protein DedD
MKTKNTGEKKNYPGSRGSAGGWMMMLFITSAFMFILGVMVGRNTAPVHFDMNTLEKKLSQLPDSVLSEKDGKENNPPEIPEKISFEFFDRLKEKNEVDEYALGRPRVLAPKYEKPDLSQINIKQPAGLVKPGPETVVKTPEPESIEIATQKQDQKLYAIQVASLRDSQKAETIRDKYRSRGYPAFTQKAMVEGKGRWSRVRIGPYTNRSQAENDLLRLQKAGVDAMLLPHEPGF